VQLIKVAGLQLAPAGIEKALGRGLEMLSKARRRDVDIVCFPEAWFHPSPYQILAKAVKHYSHIVENLRRAAREHRLWILAGGLYAEKFGVRRIVCPVISSDGEVVGVQEKMHLFGKENCLFTAGRRFQVWEVKGKKIGVLVCHDIVFPEAARALVLNGAELIFNPSRIISEGIDPWRLYAKARCLENRVPLVAVNVYIGGRCEGGSVVVGLSESGRGVVTPSIIASAGRGENMLTAELNLSRPRTLRVRRLSARRPSTYGILTEQRRRF